MSETHDNPNATVGDDGPAFNRDRLHDLDQLRLSSTDRYIGGVAGGLGQHFGIDPIVIRVLLAASCVFGGTGLLLYGVLWLFVPSDRTGRAMIDLNGPTRRTMLLIFGAIALLGVAGSVIGGFSGFSGHFAWPLALIAGACAVGLAYLRPANYRSEGSRYTASGGTRPVEGFGSAPPAGDGVTQVIPPIAPRPRRTGLLLFWPTLATILVAFGVLGMVAVDHTVAPLWWPGSALAIVGTALVVGAFRGRPGGLIPLGIVLIPSVLITTVLGTNGWHRNDVDIAPTSASAVNTQYTIGSGEATIDLTQVADLQALAGRTITVEMTAGRIDVKVPASMLTQVDAHLDIAGDIKVATSEHSGWEPAFHGSFGPEGKVAPVHLVLKGRVGMIQVETQATR